LLLYISLRTKRYVMNPSVIGSLLRLNSVTFKPDLTLQTCSPV